ncbi:MAG: glycogen/starch/alpha-glucan phosphorylase, partial [Firmicutes bacterium]|nr:glycogen/starch/alpha-glucan phosphorylase [Bacillota bacterium]
NPDAPFEPRTFIFGAKASAAYHTAKRIIKLICSISDMIHADPQVRDKLRVIFSENYCVSSAEIIIPAADVSEQISIAGKEASGTGNMKLMINGAVTLGTEDGANVEIHQAVGDDNIFIFGMRVEEVQRLLDEGSYSPFSLVQSDAVIGDVVRLMTQGFNGQQFRDVISSLTSGYNGAADPYFVLADFHSYREAQERVAAAYRDPQKWNTMSLVNIAKAGMFSADRAVKEYAERIWNIKPLPER